MPRPVKTDARICRNCKRVSDNGKTLCRRCHNERYGAEHQALRESWRPIVMTGKLPCARCKEPIPANDSWCLDHLDDGSRAPSHGDCNSQAITTRSGRVRNAKATTSEPTSRNW